MDLKGKTVLITGGARRVGREITLAFARKGASVVIHCHRSRKEADTLAHAIRKDGGKASVFSADLSNLAGVNGLIKNLKKDRIDVDILVNAASVFYPTPFEKTVEKDWNDFLSIHLKAPFFLCQALAPAMKRKGEGRIINIIDNARHPSPPFLVYGVTKAALLALTEGLAKTLAPEVLVTAVCPGLVLAPEGLPAAARRRLARAVPLKRWGTPKDVADMVVFLAESDFINGSSHVVDGGETLLRG